MFVSPVQNSCIVKLESEVIPEVFVPLDGAMQALTRAYWIAKEKNKKYTPKKYRKEQTEE